MNILVTGAAGQLGSELQCLAGKQPQHRFFFTDVQGTLPFPTQPEELQSLILQDGALPVFSLDITDATAFAQAVEVASVDIIINCAAFTNVDAAESNEALADALNHQAVAHMAATAARTGAWLIHISTDYVFGTEPYNRPCREDQQGTPTGVYGLTKLRGEKAIAASGCKHIIVRTAWLYSRHGKNFAKTIKQLINMKKEIRVVFDQVGTPTSATDLADGLLFLIDRGLREEHVGIYHYSNEGVCSWYDFATAILRLSPESTCRILPCHSDEFPSPVVRPAYSVLDKTKIKTTFGLEIPHWHDSLLRVMAQLD